MPLFNDDNMESFKANGSGFSFSGTNIGDLGSSEYTLVGIGVDRSSSVSGFSAELEGCLKSSLEGCQRSPRADYLLTRVVAFNHDLEELHGFRPLADCHLGNYTGSIKPGGTTSLYDASLNLVDSLATYGASLISQDYSANGILVIETDGMDVGSTHRAHHVRQAIERARKSECLESLVTILIGINVQDHEVSQFLTAFKNEAGFDQYVEAKDATSKTFARVAGFISKSVSSQSQALGTGGPSQAIAF